MNNCWLRFAFLTLPIFFPLVAAGQTTWDGSEADDFWFTAANWDTGVVPDGGTDQAVVGAPSPTIVNGDVDLQSLSVTAAGVLTIAPNNNFNLAGGVPTSLTNVGSITLQNNSDLRIIDTVNNTGSMTIAATTLQTDLEVGVGGATLTGGGMITLSGVEAGINDATGEQMLTIENQTIQGEGNIGRSTINVDNQTNGLIDANVSGQTLILAADNLFTNSGTLRASGGGILELRNSGTDDFMNAGGVIEALAGSEVVLEDNARIVGGTLSTTGSGLIRTPVSTNSELENLTINGNYRADNNTDTRITGTINNTGSMTIAATTLQTDLEVGVGGATLTGGGTITLSGVEAGINDFSGEQTLTVANQTIQGTGNICDSPRLTDTGRG